MIKNKAVLFVILITSVLVFAKSSQQEVITKSLTAKKGGTLEVKLNPGNVSIKAWDRNEVLLKIDGLGRDDVEYMDISERDGNVTVEYDGKMGWGRSADYYFTIPTTYNLEINTTGGDIEIHDNITGNVELQSMGGELELRSVNGNLNAETMGGDINLVDVTGDVYVSTQGGDIKLGKLKGRTKEIKTMGGDISINEIGEVRKITTYGGDITVNTAMKNLEVTTFGGNIEINECNEGVKADTYGGNILIRSANGSVDVSTGGGNITLKNIKGYVKARTGAGDIHVELNSEGNRSSDIRTNAGDIDFYVFGNSQLTVNAEVDPYWGDGDNSIQSDFEGSISKSRGDIKGVFNINGGGAEVKLRATNGTISINKK